MNATLDQTAPLRRTPLFDLHREAGAKFTGFGGWEMPVQYSGVIDEHRAVRSAAGLFDVSHMGEVLITGPQALALLQRLTSNDVSVLAPGKAQYSVLLNDGGGAVDDIIVYRLGEEEYLLCVNASNALKDFEWIVQHNDTTARAQNVSAAYAQLALQGPQAAAILAQVLRCPTETLSLAQFASFTVRRQLVRLGTSSSELLIARTGYTGEDGFEIFLPPQEARALWTTVIECGSPLGLRPIGLGARDTLRLEACLALYGHELSDEISILESGLGWILKFNKGEFIGRAALEAIAAAGVKRRLCGFEVTDLGIAREGAKVVSLTGQDVGWVTSGTKTPTVNRAIGMCYLNADCAGVGSEVWVEVRAKRLRARVVKMPFYKKVGHVS